LMQNTLHIYGCPINCLLLLVVVRASKY